MMNEDDRAVDFYTEAIKIDPEYGMAYFARGNAGYFLEDYTRAIKDYTQALGSLPEFSAEEEESHYYRALCYERIGSLDFARMDFNWVLRRSPGRYDAIRKRALLSFKERKYQAALKDIIRAREIYPASKRLSQIQKKIEVQIEKTSGRDEMVSFH